MFKVLQLVVVLFVLYCLAMIGLPWGKYVIYKSAAEKIMMNEDRLPRNRVINSLLTEASDLKVPITRKNIKFVEDYGYSITTTIEYTEKVNLPFLPKPIVFKYKIEKERPLKGD